MCTQHAGGVTSADAVTESGDEVGIEREAVREPVRRLPLFDAKARGPSVHCNRLEHTVPSTV